MTRRTPEMATASMVAVSNGVLRMGSSGFFVSAVILGLWYVITFGLDHRCYRLRMRLFTNAIHDWEAQVDSQARRVIDQFDAGAM
jgi:hypothetical protein